RGGEELHPPDRAGRGDREVPVVVGLDLVDARQHLPGDLVLNACGLVDRDQERRDAERVDEEVRDADRGGTGQRQRVGRIGGRGHALAGGQVLVRRGGGRRLLLLL